MMSCLSLLWTLSFCKYSSSLMHMHDIDVNIDQFCRLGFGVQLNALSSKEKVPFAASFDHCQMNSFQRFVNPLWQITEKLHNLMHPWQQSIQDHLNVVDSFANDVIEGRRAQLAKGEVHHDLLSRFMNALNEHGEELSNTEVI